MLVSRRERRHPPPREMHLTCAARRRSLAWIAPADEQVVPLVRRTPSGPSRRSQEDAAGRRRRAHEGHPRGGGERQQQASRLQGAACGSSARQDCWAEAAARAPVHQARAGVVEEGVAPLGSPATPLSRRACRLSTKPKHTRWRARWPPDASASGPMGWWDRRPWRFVTRATGARPWSVRPWSAGAMPRRLGAWTGCRSMRPIGWPANRPIRSSGSQHGGAAAWRSSS
jgi:hypothetical protein